VSGLSIQSPLVGVPNAPENRPAEGSPPYCQSFEVWLDSPCSDARAVYGCMGPSLCGRVVAAPMAGLVLVISNVAIRTPIVILQGVWECSKCLAKETRFLPGF